jgi:hypothetical protein
MSSNLFADLQLSLTRFDRTKPESVPQLVDDVLREAVRQQASDVHFDPTHRDVEIRFRLDGVLQPAARIAKDTAPNIIARLKVLAELLTYRTDIPQEGERGFRAEFESRPNTHLHRNIRRKPRRQASTSRFNLEQDETRALHRFAKRVYRSLAKGEPAGLR